MLARGAIRRIRQTLMATNLAPGALVAWQVPAEQLDAAFDYLAKDDPFSGHVVIRSTDAETPGSVYRLWTTLKVPQGFSMQRHCELLAARIGADGVPHHAGEAAVRARRRTRAPPRHGARQPHRGAGRRDRHEHRRAERRSSGACSAPLKREFAPRRDARRSRGARAPRRPACRTTSSSRVARGLAERGVIGRFSTFLEHVKPSRDRRARDALQRALPLARAGGARDRGGPRGRPPPHPDARLLARGRRRSSRT